MIKTIEHEGRIYVLDHTFTDGGMRFLSEEAINVIHAWYQDRAVQKEREDQGFSALSLGGFPP